MTYSIAVYDQYEIFRRALESILKNSYPDSFIFTASSLDELKEVSKIVSFDLLILDIIVGKANKFSFIKDIRFNDSAIKILIFTFNKDDSYKEKCIKYGASGIMNKDCKEVNISCAICYYWVKRMFLLRILKKAQKRKNYLKDLKNKIFRALSSREFELAELLIEGNSNLMIANKMNIASSTVSTLKKRIFLKTRTSNVIQLAEIFNTSKLFV